jgi:hypothetical protein
MDSGMYAPGTGENPFSVTGIVGEGEGMVSYSKMPWSQYSNVFNGKCILCLILATEDNQILMGKRKIWSRLQIFDRHHLFSHTESSTTQRTYISESF